MNNREYTKDDFLWVWKDSSVYDILDQYYWDYKELRNAYARIDKAIEYLKQPNRDGFDFSKAQLLEILEGNGDDCDEAED